MTENLLLKSARSVDPGPKFELRVWEAERDARTSDEASKDLHVEFAYLLMSPCNFSWRVFSGILFPSNSEAMSHVLWSLIEICPCEPV